MNTQDTIIALATPSGSGAISVIKLSGNNAISIVNQFFNSIHDKKLINQKTHTVHLGHVVDGERVIDEVLVSLFKNPQSYTGEDVVEISCHGSLYIQQEIIQLFLQNGCRMADAGEFTLRAFLNGKLDLSQAEAVADLIASDSKASHQIAMQQMRGGFSNEIESLRQDLLNFASLIELELDFSEEDVEFANRGDFQKLITKISTVLKRLIESFAFGNVLKNGIPVAIIGEPNVGKSTLLNALLNEEKAIVSAIAGTTRDAIEDELIIEGVAYRFIDTAGIRDTTDEIENIGIKKTFEKTAQAQLIIYLFDASIIRKKTELESAQLLQMIVNEIKKVSNKFPDKKMLILANKSDLLSEKEMNQIEKLIKNTLFISAKENEGINELKNHLTDLSNMGALSNNQTIVSNSRHFEVLNKALIEIKNVQKGIDNNISSDLIAIDIRQALQYLGEITGKVTNEDLLGNIFANFCIGK
ncbi:tRNA uridine-5-carboxymethylaminomethyl(34) synthesis GTPase MnmE [Aureibaculum sp. 2210JD6-5]|uniref:tRNA uridine-5-carboxymethylaminomethyl(34) synthesis GTPase MnmE n=1 Tax=Aureibaculum sp. 2210JD6-5 TaxID=3103957 RepID=UPI002AACC8B9|nr:tRNA uridine-5-carboxymethylaminomethyl(34) synthesis GTPase MnmE [Aureibaculum sp. 2210JD6-5]MDY7395145.1 tRNA uridine-5-carboxymethylaminomethyl(34) synthesis GTPase MnmE [Aureibaculum sp. 2210JD6-5]